MSAGFELSEVRFAGHAVQRWARICPPSPTPAAWRSLSVWASIALVSTHGTKVSPDQAAPTYDEDFFEWTQHTAALLRAGRVAEVDVEHLAEEVEDMGKRDRREVDSRVTVLLTHLLKWQKQPEHRCRSWKSTILTQRDDLGRVLQDSPSLRRRLGSELRRTFRVAVQAAQEETGVFPDRFPRECPWTPEQILDQNFLPDD